MTASGAPLGPLDSVKRNALFGIGPALNFTSATIGLVPCLGDALNCFLWPLVILGALATLAVVGLEVARIVQTEDGARFGDQIAETTVSSA
jgi:hypothetical protein